MKKQWKVWLGIGILYVGFYFLMNWMWIVNLKNGIALGLTNEQLFNQFNVIVPFCIILLQTILIIPIVLSIIGIFILRNYRQKRMAIKLN